MIKFTDELCDNLTFTISVFKFEHDFQQIFLSIVDSTRACHARDRSSILRGREFFAFSFDEFYNEI